MCSEHTKEIIKNDAVRETCIPTIAFKTTDISHLHLTTSLLKTIQFFVSWQHNSRSNNYRRTIENTSHANTQLKPKTYKHLHTLGGV